MEAKAPAKAPEMEAKAPAKVPADSSQPRRTRAERHMVLRVLIIVWEVHFACCQYFKRHVAFPSGFTIFEVTVSASGWERRLYNSVKGDYWTGRYKRRCLAAGVKELNLTQEELEGIIEE